MGASSTWSSMGGVFSKGELGRFPEAGEVTGLLRSV
jgi:hypothetical protein